MIHLIGPQGSGKSTLARLLVAGHKAVHGGSAITLVADETSCLDRDQLQTVSAAHQLTVVEHFDDASAAAHLTEGDIALDVRKVAAEPTANRTRSGRICVDCAHCTQVRSRLMCDHPSTPIDTIDGMPYVECSTSRRAGPCGREARLFEVRPSTAERPACSRDAASTSTALA